MGFSLRSFIGSDMFGVACTGYSPALHQAARAVPGARRIDKEVRGPGHAIALVLAHLRARGLRTVPDDPVQRPVGAPGVPIAETDARDYQRHGVRFLIARKRCILADDMGLGKTMQAILAARAMAASGGTLVVCHGNMRLTWEKEFTRWWPDAVVYHAYGTKPKAMFRLERTDVVIVNYEALHAWTWLQPRTIIADEGHALASADSRRSIAFRAAASGATFAWVLSGTPLTNRPRDLWNVLDTLQPDSFGSFFEYGVRYCAGHQKQVTQERTAWDFDGASNAEELHARLQWVMLRRLKSDVALQLPAKTRAAVWVDVPAPKQPREAFSRRALRGWLDAAADLKLDDVAARLIERAREGAKIVAFCHRRRVADELTAAALESGVFASIVHGGIPQKKRAAAIDAARAALDGFILAVTIDTCATGIDLSFAQVASFVEMTWEPHELLQCEARLHRFKQKSPVLCEYNIARGTVDELILDSVVTKLDSFERIIGETGENLAALKETEEAVFAGLTRKIEAAKRH